MTNELVMKKKVFITFAMGLYNETLQIHILMELDRFRIKLVSSGSDNAHELEQTNTLAYYVVRNVL